MIDVPHKLDDKKKIKIANCCLWQTDRNSLLQSCDSFATKPCRLLKKKTGEYNVKSQPSIHDSKGECTTAVVCGRRNFCVRYTAEFRNNQQAGGGRSWLM
jgi:hypothetical protein